MNIDGRHYRTIWPDQDNWSVHIIDQTKLPHEFVINHIQTVEQVETAITSMQVRGAPLIGALAAYGMCLSIRNDPSTENIESTYTRLLATRPTAVNLRWALDDMKKLTLSKEADVRQKAAYERAKQICNEDIETCKMIGVHGLGLIEKIALEKKGKPVNILTHCNAGWLATIDWGTATSPIYRAHELGHPLHVWVDETRPRNQGASLTAFELGQHGINHTIITDNAGGHLMQRGKVDLCIVGTDRTTANGDVANKIGTYLKALAAKDNSVPFYVALPHNTIDWSLTNGFDIPIEERDPREVTQMTGRTGKGDVITVDIATKGSPAANPAFDVTPAHMITGLITERGVCEASESGLKSLYPEYQKAS